MFFVYFFVFLIKFVVNKYLYMKNTLRRNQTRIDELMAIKGIKTDVDLAKELEITKQALYSKLAGSISLKTLEKLAKFFDVHIKEMFKD